jgi:Fur family ferric uptake transcriptional regulator
MDTIQKEKNIALIKDVLRNYLLEKGFRNTPERYTILKKYIIWIITSMWMICTFNVAEKIPRFQSNNLQYN